MGTDSPTSDPSLFEGGPYDSFAELGEQLLRQTFPTFDEATIVRYMRRGMARVDAIAGRHASVFLLSTGTTYPQRPDFRSVDFHEVRLSDSLLEGADLTDANL